MNGAANQTAETITPIKDAFSDPEAENQGNTLTVAVGSYSQGRELNYSKTPDAIRRSGDKLLNAPASDINS